MEQWDIYTENREKTGRLHTRGEKMAVGDYHLVVTALIFNSKGELLIQKRREDKIGWPGFWDFSAAGSALAGESSRQAMIREIKEELGIDVTTAESQLRFTWYFPDGFDDFWIIYHDVALEELTLQKEEVQEARWVNEEEFQSLVKAGEMIPYFFNETLFSWIHKGHLHE
ncbi:NUDIX hydrolase [Enterococcus sp. JM4C]|uniref:NUDIX hydrolase n=1 Tax=Candidatus Enterococcus huntleyi TaxID=1857217 RepID=UPI00137A48E1|nr:NUDIX domain-containing protein [Enterococcus sp. JM4C]KAF1299320.1 NUDIX hydrolase [Enterococcus sp. JM4C]